MEVGRQAGKRSPSTSAKGEAVIASERRLRHRSPMWNLNPPRLALATIALVSFATPTFADDPAPLCPPRWGAPGRPLVTTPETAKAIFLAVEADFFPAADREGFPEVVAEDEGEWWSVFRYRPSERQPDGSLGITYGGGQLSFRIAKCDAKIAEVWLTR